MEQISKTGRLDSIPILRQYGFDLIARFMENKSINPKVGRDQRTKELGCPCSTLQRYRQDINMLSAYRIPPNSKNRKQKISYRKQDTERPQMTSNDLKRHQLTSKKFSPETFKPKKNKLKGGANIEINDNHSDEILHNNNL